jgi:hypothetical protein
LLGYVVDSRPELSWSCLLLFLYNLRDQFLLSIYPWLRNRCLPINNSSLLVSAGMSHVPVASQRLSWPFGQNATFIPAYTLPYNYTVS